MTHIFLAKIPEEIPFLCAVLHIQASVAVRRCGRIYQFVIRSVVVRGGEHLVFGNGADLVGIVLKNGNWRRIQVLLHSAADRFKFLLLQFRHGLPFPLAVSFKRGPPIEHIIAKPPPFVNRIDGAAPPFLQARPRASPVFRPPSPQQMQNSLFFRRVFLEKGLTNGKLACIILLFDAGVAESADAHV